MNHSNNKDLVINTMEYILLNTTLTSFQNIETNIKCCWKCTKCEDNEIMLDEETCKTCSKGWWPNEDLSGQLIINK